MYILKQPFNYLFFSENNNDQQVIPSMPGVYRFGLNKLIEHLNPLVDMGLTSVLLFGVIDNLPKVKVVHDSNFDCDLANMIIANVHIDTSCV